jgi:hypothetical protein
MYLALLETSANQQFIFSTNKLRENIGASELTYRAGTQWVVEAIASVNGSSPDPKIFKNSADFRDWLLDSTQNPSVLDPLKLEILIATSGKALFLAQNRDDARSVIRQVTQRALREAPGLDICGVISDEFDIKSVKLSEINKQIHQKFESVRANRPGPESRFLRLPIVAECATSGMPATQVISDVDNEVTITSEVSNAKRNARDDGLQRIQRLLQRGNPQWKFLDKDDEFEQESAWKAIIHADGNGLGQIFLDFGKGLDSPADGNFTQFNSNYIQQYREFSTAIDICTEQAFLNAIEAIFADRLQRIPMRPLILGGDDLTVICAGQYALQFTAEFLRNFENLTSKEIHGFVTPKIIIDQAAQHLPAPRLSACAGVAIVKNHFPFSVAYHLAEELIKSAKTVKNIIQNDQKTPIPCSAIDYHVLYDSSGVDLDSIRDKLEIANPPTRLYSRPYIVSDLKWYTDNKEWLDQHYWSKLADRVAVLQAKNEEGRYQLPNSQMHDLREGLFLGHKNADARYKLIRERYLAAQITILEGDQASKSLFWQEAKKPDLSDKPEIYTTGLLDAMDASSFWEGKKGQKQ